MSTLANLNKRTSVESLSKKIQALQSNQKDPRYWTLTSDKAGNGYAIIRFLPAAKVDFDVSEDAPEFVMFFEHFFRGPSGTVYAERSLTSVGEDDPVSEYNSKLWATGVESNKNLARAQKRNQKYVSNIFVVKDPANPANDGKVFLFKYGPSIFEMVESQNKPIFDDKKAYNPYSFEEGANFKLRIRKDEKKQFPTYDKSEWEPQSKIPAKLQEEIWSKEYSLLDEVSPDKFKTYDELKKKLDKVLGQPSVGSSVAAATEVETEIEDLDKLSVGDGDELLQRLANE